MKKAVVINKMKKYTLTGNYRPDGFEYFGKKVTVLKPTSLCRCRIIDGEDINGFDFITLSVRGVLGYAKDGRIFKIIKEEI